ncbi:MAG: HlyC/CorC family transporter [Ignavibacteriaceae bacterium]|nr:HlyC/CorC family transporter [Ignavibacteriaceae bacterium]
MAALSLLLLNGVFAMAEIALVSSTKMNLLKMKNSGSKGASDALDLLKEPEKFLSAVQIGITLIGIVAGVVGGVSIADDLIPFFAGFELIRKYAEEVSYIVVVSLLTYFSVVIGELIPKAIAFKNPEKIAALLSPFMKVILNISLPFVWIFSKSTSSFLKLFKVTMNEEKPVTEEELKFYIQQGMTSGSLDKRESEILNQVFAFGDKSVFSTMTHKNKIISLDVNATVESIKSIIRSEGYSRYPVYEGRDDNIIGILEVKDFYEELLNSSSEKLNRMILTEPAYFLKQTPASKALDIFKSSKIHFGVVIDEYGSLQGITTLHDLIENILGSFPDFDEAESDRIKKRDDGSVFLSGDLRIEEVNEALKINLPLSQDYSTLAGLILNITGRIPEVGEMISYNDYRFEIADRDGPRIDKIILYPLTGI